MRNAHRESIDSADSVQRLDDGGMTMKIIYENTLEDAIAFNRYHYSNSDTFRKQKDKVTIHLPVALFFAVVILTLLIRDIRIAVWGSVFIGSYLIFIFRAYNRDLYKTVGKLYKEQDMKGFVCEHQLEINEDGILEKTEVNERKDKWSGVQLIGADPAHAFIYVGAMQAHIIPRERIVEGDYDRFLESAKSYWSRFNSAPAAAVK